MSGLAAAVGENVRDVGSLLVVPVSTVSAMSLSLRSLRSCRLQPMTLISTDNSAGREPFRRRLEERSAVAGATTATQFLRHSCDGALRDEMHTLSDLTNPAGIPGAIALKSPQGLKRA
jgi:hypothetical protein